MTITSNDRDTISNFVETRIIIVYAWNGDPIDGTVIIRSIPVIGQGLTFPLHINLPPLSTLSQNHADSAAQYPYLTYSSRKFATFIRNSLI